MRESSLYRAAALRDCPCCGYKNALSVTVKEGRELFYCHAGCSQADLLRALHGERPLVERFCPVQRKPDMAGDFALKLWAQSQPAEGTPVQAYLAARGLSGRVPPALRFLPSALHKPTGTHWPCMLAAAMDEAGRMKAVHRTYLSPDGKGKAPVEPAKMTLGRVGGLSCHLAEVGEELAVSEGIETGLSVHQATGLPTWAALSAGGIRNLILPPLPMASRVLIAADADPVGLRAARAAAFLWREQGRRVRIATPPEGLDFNDVLLKGAAA